MVGNAGEAQLFFSRQIGIGEEDGDVIPIEGGVRVSGKIGSSCASDADYDSR